MPTFPSHNDESGRHHQPERRLEENAISLITTVIA